jgi:hypothetical protein
MSMVLPAALSLVVPLVVLPSLVRLCQAGGAGCADAASVGGAVLSGGRIGEHSIGVRIASAAAGAPTAFSTTTWCPTSRLRSTQMS